MKFDGWEAARAGALLAMSLVALNAQASYRLKALAGHDSVSALNHAGTAVGNDDDAPGATGLGDPFIWSNCGIAAASDINYRGQREAFLLTPAAPEPSSSTWILAGLAVLGALAWRQRDD